MGTTLITALDVDTQDAALAVVDRIAGGRVVQGGQTTVYRCGAEVVRGLKARGKKSSLT